MVLRGLKLVTIGEYTQDRISWTTPKCSLIPRDGCFGLFTWCNGVGKEAWQDQYCWRYSWSYSVCIWPKEKTKHRKENPLCNVFSLSIENLYLTFLAMVIRRWDSFSSWPPLICQFYAICYKLVLLIIRYTNRQGPFNCDSYTQSYVCQQTFMFHPAREKERERG